MAKKKVLRQPQPDDPFILVAEDDEDDAFAMELAFEKAGLARRVWRVRNGGEAIDYLSGGGKYSDRREYPLPSLLLLDLSMSRMSGFEVLRWVRSNPRLKNLVAVVLTNSARKADLEKAYQFGADSYLIKPAGFLGFADMLKSLQAYWSMNQVPSQRRSFQRDKGR